MAYQLKEGQGSLFPNKNRRTAKSPNSTGKILIDGKTYYLSGWTNTTGDGTKWLSLQAKPADEYAQTGPEDDDEPPF